MRKDVELEIRARIIYKIVISQLFDNCVVIKAIAL